MPVYLVTLTKPEVLALVCDGTGNRAEPAANDVDLRVRYIVGESLPTSTWGSLHTPRMPEVSGRAAARRRVAAVTVADAEHSTDGNAERGEMSESDGEFESNTSQTDSEFDSADETDPEEVSPVVVATGPRSVADSGFASEGDEDEIPPDEEAYLLNLC